MVHWRASGQVVPRNRFIADREYYCNLRHESKVSLGMPWVIDNSCGETEFCQRLGYRLYMWCCVF